MKVIAVIALIFYAVKIQASLENCNDIDFNILNDPSRNIDNTDGGFCDSLDSPYTSPDWKGPGNIIISFLIFKEVPFCNTRSSAAFFPNFFTSWCI